MISVTDFWFTTLRTFDINSHSCHRITYNSHENIWMQVGRGVLIYLTLTRAGGGRRQVEQIKHILPKVARLVVKGGHSLLCPKATTYNKWWRRPKRGGLTIRNICSSSIQHSRSHRKVICGHRAPQFLVPSG